MSGATVAGRARLADPQGVQRLLKSADAVMLLIATMGVFLGSSLWIPPHAASLVAFLVLEVALGSVLMMAWLGLYGLDVLLHPQRGIASSLAATVGLGSIVFMSTHWVLFALEPLWLSGWAGLCLLHFTITRTAAFLWAKPKAARGAFRQRVAVVGSDRVGHEAFELLRVADPVRLEVIGLFDERTGAAEDFSYLAGEVEDGELDLIVVAIPLSAETRLLQTLLRLWPLPVDIRIFGQPSELKLSPRAYGHFGKLPLMSVFDRSLKRRRRGKLVLDRVLATALLLILMPALVLAAAAIRLESRGGVLVKERRYGFDRAPIDVYRLRCSHLVDTAGEMRPTWVGRALRLLCLDGAPQLLNVLKGELSLVGPRPYATAARPANLYQQVVDGYFARHKVKPGVTGLAQIHGWPDVRSADLIGSSARHDLEYVDRSSLLFDLYILIKAPFAILRQAVAR